MAQKTLEKKTDCHVRRKLQQTLAVLFSPDKRQHLHGLCLCFCREANVGSECSNILILDAKQQQRPAENVKCLLGRWSDATLE